MSKIILQNTLMEKDVVSSIKNNFYTLIDLIPEIKSMVGFEHNHPHHHLDVWNHTLLALSKAPCDFQIRLVLLLHDIGKPHSYQDEEVRHFKNHPTISSNMSKDILKRLNFNSIEIEEICYLIKKHDSLILNKDIQENISLVRKRFKIQFCDALAHNPLKLEKRIEYLLKMNDKINEENEKREYIIILNEFLKKQKNNKIK